MAWIAHPLDSRGSKIYFWSPPTSVFEQSVTCYAARPAHVIYFYNLFIMQLMMNHTRDPQSHLLACSLSTKLPLLINNPPFLRLCGLCRQRRAHAPLLLRRRTPGIIKSCVPCRHIHGRYLLKPRVAVTIGWNVALLINNHPRQTIRYTLINEWTPRHPPRKSLSSHSPLS